MLLAGIGLLSGVLSWWLSRPGSSLRILDVPNERSLHLMPTPRTGGIAIGTALLAGWLASLFFHAGQQVPWQIVAGAMLVAAVSLLDDRYGLSPLPRLLVHALAGLVLALGGFVVQGELLPGIVFEQQGLLAAGGTLFLVMWFSNLYNFMDGMDGLAGGMAVIGFGALGLLGLLHGDFFFAAVALAISAAAVGFLCFNLPPARLFMGDSGSITLGFLVASLAIWAGRREVVPLWQVLVIFLPFVADATVTLLRRSLQGEALMEAHSGHYYQRLVRAGWSQRRVMLIEYAIMLLGCLGVLLVVEKSHPVQWFMIVTLLCGYLAAMLGIRFLEERTQ